MKTILFDESAKEFILSAFDKDIDESGFIVEKNNPGQRVLAQDGQEVEAKDFAGIKKGSEVFIKSDLISLIKLSDSLRE
jgi:hypothetical protein